MKKTLLWIIRICSLAILVLPLYVDGNTIYPYTFSKIIAFQFLVEVSLGAYIALQFLDQSYQVNWKNKLIQAQSLWIGVLALLSFMGVDAIRSWWSTAQWMTGTITYLHFFAWFIVLSSVFREWKEWRAMIWASTLVSLVVALLGMGQLIGIGAEHYDPEQGRIYSTLGNPIYLAHYLLLNIFLALFLWIKEKALFAKILLGFCGCVFAGTIFFTGTRSSVLILFISLVLFPTFMFFGMASRKYRILSLSACAAVIVCVVGLFFWLQSASGVAWAHDHMSYGLQRLVNQTFQDPARIELSRIAFQGFLARPLVGWGPNNYSYVFSTYVKPHDFGILFSKLWYDAVHNQVMNVLATTGIIGLCTFLLPWCAAWWLLWRRYISTHSARMRIGLSTLGLLFFAYFLQNLTVFDTSGPLIILYFSFALVVFLTKEDEKKVGDEEVKKNTILPPNLILGLVGILTVLAIMSFSRAPYEKGQLGKRAIDTVMSDFDRGFLFFQRTLSGPSLVNDDVRNQLARAALSYDEKYRFPVEKKKEFLDFAVAQMEASSKNHPYSLEYDTTLLELYHAQAKFSSSALVRAEELAQKLVERYPHRRDVLFAYMAIKRDLGKIDTAEEYAQKIIELDPTRADAHWWMAQVLAYSSDSDRAYSEIEKARTMGYPIFNDASLFIQLALRPSGEKYKRLNAYLMDSWNKNELRSLDLAHAAAITQTKIGNSKIAQFILEWIHDHDPEYAKNVEEVLRGLKK